MKKSGFAVKIAVLILTIFLLITVGGVYAWFVTGEGAADSVVITSGDADINAKFYAAKYGAAVVPAAISDRESFIADNYYELSKDSLNEYPSFIQGTGEEFLLVATSNTVGRNISVESAFSSFREEFFSAVNDEQTDSGVAYMEQYTAHIMFSLDSLRARIYTAEGESWRLTASSDTADTAEGVEKIALNAADKSGFYFWEIAGGENFVEGIVLEPEQRMELTFTVNCLQVERVFENYLNFWRSYSTENGLDEALTQRILAFAEKELHYIGADSGESGNDISFKLEKLYVIATLLAEGTL